METRITILPKEIADKIAAGEVIERPASIVKELLENSIDAGADDIVIELEEGGKGSIRITDSGIGIDAQDIAIAFERHATSKIKTLEDIYRIDSFGFRGEALPSIVAVSDMELLTRRRGDLSGIRAEIEGGKIKKASSVGCPEGTSIFVRNIFGSIPARRKFLKKDSVELGYCLDVITRLALAHPDIKITVRNNGKTVLKVPRTGDLAEKIALLLGADFKTKIIPINGARNGVRIGGYISRPDFTRSSSKSTYIYVNRRWVRDHLISHAIVNAYKGLIEARKYPAAVLFIDLPPEEVDVNVHPAKTEVRFRDSNIIYAMVLETLALGLSGPLAESQSGSVPYSQGNSSASSDATPFTPPRPDRRPFSSLDNRFQINDSTYRYFISTGPAKSIFTPDLLSHSEQSSTESAVDIPDIRISENLPEKDFPGQSGFFSNLIFMGRISGTYLIFEGSTGMVLLDQHAAHERILYEKLKDAESREPYPSQALLMPEVVDLTAAEYALLLEQQPIFQKMGVELSMLGNNSVAVKSLPVFMNADPGMTIKDIAAEAAEFGKVHTPDEIKDKIFASMACKGAVKAKERISEKEVVELCRDLDRIPHSASCPHGRPLYVILTLKDLEKMFKRQ